MLDSRRDCRYRGGAHRDIRVGLGKVTFHNMLGTSSGVPGFLLTLIHPSAWKGSSPKVICRMLHSPGPIGSGEAALHRSATPRAQESAERPWWRRMFGG
jgi:hypothetical protein